jgi:hypothetical protein
LKLIAHDFHPREIHHDRADPDEREE